MAQKRCKVYEASQDGKVIARGFADDVAKAIGVNTQSVIWCGSHEGMAGNKYLVTTVGTAVKHYNGSGASQITPLGETFVERYRDLDEFGNTIMTPKEYRRHKSLIENKGYNVRYREIKHGRAKYYLLEVL